VSREGWVLLDLALLDLDLLLAVTLNYLLILNHH